MVFIELPVKKNSEIIVEDFSTLDHLPSTLD